MTISERPRGEAVRTIHLGALGTDLRGPAIGVVVAKFLERCRDEAFHPVVDCRGTRRVSEEVLFRAAAYLEDMYDDRPYPYPEIVSDKKSLDGRILFERVEELFVRSRYPK